MKKLFRNMMAICIAIVAMSSLTSCLKEDNEDFTITAEERSKIFNNRNTFDANNSTRYGIKTSNY